MTSDEVKKKLDSEDYYRVRSGRIKTNDICYSMDRGQYEKCLGIVGDRVEKTPDYIIFRPCWTESFKNASKSVAGYSIALFDANHPKWWGNSRQKNHKAYLAIPFPDYLLKKKTVEIDLEELSAFKKRIEELEKQGDKNK